jgi:indolepyruvate ferredoxin oxidoreductase
VAIASIPEKIRGFGPIKLRSVPAAKAEEAALLARFRSASRPAPVAAAAE